MFSPTKGFILWRICDLKLASSKRRCFCFHLDCLAIMCFLFLSTPQSPGGPPCSPCPPGDTTLRRRWLFYFQETFQCSKTASNYFKPNGSSRSIWLRLSAEKCRTADFPPFFSNFPLICFPDSWSSALVSGRLLMGLTFLSHELYCGVFCN